MASEEFPYEVAIYANDAFRGNGVLITSTNVLTTASVVDGSLPSTLRVEAGSNHMGGTGSSLLGGGTSVLVANYTIHQDYNNGPVPYANDIAIINLATALTFSDSIYPAMLPVSNQDQFVGFGKVSGW